MVDGVTKRYEFTGTWAVLNDIVSSNVVDPLTGGAARSTTAEWIKNGFPNPGKFGCRDPSGWVFPLIIISIPDIETDAAVLDASKFFITHSLSISCSAKTRAGASELAEEVKYILEVTGADDLRKAALHGPDVVGTNEDVDFVGSTKYYTKVVDYEFRRFD